jgi:hypothetical protein
MPRSLSATGAGRQDVSDFDAAAGFRPLLFFTSSLLFEIRSRTQQYCTLMMS